MHRSILDRLSTNMRSTCRSTVNRESTNVLVELPLMSADVSTVTISVRYRSTTGGISVNYRPICRPLLWYRSTMGHNNSKTPNKISIFLSYKYYRPMYREIYWPMSRLIYQPMSRPIYSVKYRYTIGEASVNYRWTPTMSTDRSVGLYIGRYSTDISTKHRQLHGRYSTDIWSSVDWDIDRYIDQYISRSPL